MSRVRRRGGVGARRRKADAPTNIVYFEDRNTLYDAPLDVVWDFMTKDETFHPRAHKGSVRKFASKALSEITGLLSWEERDGPRWRRRSARMTVVRPAVRIQEELDGRYAGSTLVFVYSPRGRRTRVDVLCYMQPDGRTPAQLEAAWRREFSKNFREDGPWLRKFARSRASTE